MEKSAMTARLSRFAKHCAMALVVAFGVSSCSETINEGNFAIKSEETALDFLTSNPQFSKIKAIYDRVRLGRTEDASSLSSVLSARGNYTVFAPNDSAVDKFLNELGVATLEDLTYEQAQLIALNSIIDNGSESAYESADFPTPGSFTLSNLNDRVLTCAQDSTGLTYVINGTSLVAKFDNEVSNGMVHEVNAVIAPSADDIATRLAAADNMKIFGRLLMETSWADSLTKYRDDDYEAQNWSNVTSYRLASEKNTVIYRNTSRYYGYTIFAEPDSIYNDKLGISVSTNEEGEITNWNDVLRILVPYCQSIYGTAAADDLKNPDNAVNQFVAYHLIKGKMAYDKFVHHCNEFNYQWGSSIKNPQLVNMPTNVWDYYTTMGPHRRLIKITQVGDQSEDATIDVLEHPIFVNRISTYDNKRSGDYHETGFIARGKLIGPDNGNNDNNAQNGFYYPIDDMLVFDETTQNLFAQERLRIDMVTMLPELLTNGNRGGKYTLFEKGYIENVINESTDTHFCYLMDQGGGSWNDYQGDEFLICGLFDFTLRLPPVPKSGTYELRMGTALNAMRGMAQMYFGSDPFRMAPAGLPYDMRQQVSATNIEIPWQPDVEDNEVNAENDKNLRNHGYLKGPNYFCITNGKSDTPVRQRSGGTACIRRIIGVFQMDANKTYYLRFKTALKKLDSQFFLDYFEIVPTVIYNGAQEEDIW